MVPRWSDVYRRRRACSDRYSLGDPGIDGGRFTPGTHRGAPDRHEKNAGLCRRVCAGGCVPSRFAGTFPGRAKLPHPPDPMGAGHKGRHAADGLAGVFFLGIAVSAFLFYGVAKRGSARANGETNGTPAITLSESTRAVLGRMEAPLEIRFYALLDAATVPNSVTAFAGRVEQLLSAYQQQASGKLKVTSVNSQSIPNANAALADGLTAFNLDKGQACFLGVALVLNGRKETLPQIGR